MLIPIAAAVSAAEVFRAADRAARDAVGTIAMELSRLARPRLGGAHVDVHVGQVGAVRGVADGGARERHGAQRGDVPDVVVEDALGRLLQQNAAGGNDGATVTSSTMVTLCAPSSPLGIRHPLHHSPDHKCTQVKPYCSAPTPPPLPRLTSAVRCPCGCAAPPRPCRGTRPS